MRDIQKMDRGPERLVGKRDRRANRGERRKKGRAKESDTLPRENYWWGPEGWGAAVAGLRFVLVLVSVPLPLTNIPTFLVMDSYTASQARLSP